MKQITFRQLQTNTEWLSDLPVEVVRYGKVVVVIDHPGQKQPEKQAPKASASGKKLEKIPKKGSLCQHGINLAIGSCKYGCKRG